MRATQSPMVLSITTPFRLLPAQATVPAGKEQARMKKLLTVAQMARFIHIVWPNLKTDAVAHNMLRPVAELRKGIIPLGVPHEDLHFMYTINGRGAFPEELQLRGITADGINPEVLYKFMQSRENGEANFKQILIEFASAADVLDRSELSCFIGDLSLEEIRAAAPLLRMYGQLFGLPDNPYSEVSVLFPGDSIRQSVAVMAIAREIKQNEPNLEGCRIAIIPPITFDRTVYEQFQAGMIAGVQAFLDIGRVEGRIIVDHPDAWMAGEWGIGNWKQRNVAFDGQRTSIERRCGNYARLHDAARLFLLLTNDRRAAIDGLTMLLAQSAVDVDVFNGGDQRQIASELVERVTDRAIAPSTMSPLFLP